LSPVSIFSNYLPEKNPFFQDNILFERVPEAVTLTNGIIGSLRPVMPDCSLTAKGFRYSMAESAEEPLIVLNCNYLNSA
jgi:hypothetical protein